MDKAKLNKLGQKEGSSLAHLQGRDPYLMNEGDYAPILFLSFFPPLRIKLKDGMYKEFKDKAASLSPLERGDLLDKTSTIIDLHKEVAAEGQTEVC